MARLARVEEPSEPEINSIRNDSNRLAAIRSRLSDIGWWMRLLCQQIATRSNRDDHENGFLAPITLDERTGELGAVASPSGLRCSDKGFLPMTQEDYLVLLDWTARQSAPEKRGATPKALRPIFERFSLDPKVWCALVGSFGRLFYNVAGLPPTIEATTSRVTQRRYNIRSTARKLFSSAAQPSSA